MKIKIEEQSDHFRADCLDLPGTPPVGLGKTREMAVTCLMWRLWFESPVPGEWGLLRRTWYDYLKQEEPIVVIDKLGETIWDWPESYKKST